MQIIDHTEIGVNTHLVSKLGNKILVMTTDKKEFILFFNLLIFDEIVILFSMTIRVT